MILMLYLFGFFGLGALIYIARPELVISFGQNFPNLTTTDIPLSLVIINYFFLSIGIALSRVGEGGRSDIPLIASGVIVASTVSFVLSLSFVFNILWSFITPKYLIFITIAIYLLKLGIPLFVYDAKASQSNKPTNQLDDAKRRSEMNRLLAEIRLHILESGINNSNLDDLNLNVDIKSLNNAEIDIFISNLENLTESLNIPATISQKIKLLKSSRQLEI